MDPTTQNIDQTKEIGDLKRRILSLENNSSEINSVLNQIKGVRPRIKNFEGALKVFSAAPPVADFEEGCLILANESGTYKLYVLINGAWRSATFT